MLGVFVDTETTGLDPFLHVPIEIAIVVVDLATGVEIGSYETLLLVSDEEWRSQDVNSSLIHGISRERLTKGLSRFAAAIDIERLLVSLQITNDQSFFI